MQTRLELEPKEDCQAENGILVKILEYRANLHKRPGRHEIQSALLHHPMKQELVCYFFANEEHS